MRKMFLLLLCLFVFQNISSAKDILQFDFPDSGWHKVASPDGIEGKKCYVPYNQSSESYTEMLVFFEKVLKNHDLTPIAIMQKQLGKDRNNYQDIEPSYISADLENPIVTWCSKYRNTCAVQRAFKGSDGIIFASYINKAPHYSQNIFGQWPNILSSIKIYSPQADESTPSNLIEM